MLNSLLHLPKLNGSTFDMILYTSLSDAKADGRIKDFAFIPAKNRMKDASMIVVTLLNGKVKQMKANGSVNSIFKKLGIRK